MLDDRSYMREPEWRDAPRKRWAWSMVKILLVINLAVFLLLNIVAHYGSDTMSAFVKQFLILKSGAVKAGVDYRTNVDMSSGQIIGLWDGAVWQLFTYQFMHFGLWHILCNMIGLFFIGRFMRWRAGDRYDLDGAFARYRHRGSIGFRICPNLSIDLGYAGQTTDVTSIFCAAYHPESPDDFLGAVCHHCIFYRVSLA